MQDRHQAPSYPLRMPTGLRELLEKAAEENGRSVNQEIIARLEESFGNVPPLKRGEIVEIVRITLDEWKAAERKKK